jgi:hypothetical protein
MSKRTMRTLTMAGVLLALVGLASGCERKPDEPSSGPESREGGPLADGPSDNASAEEAKPARRLVSTDHEDAPDAPRALPKSDQVRGWIKTEPVRVYAAEDIGNVFADPPRKKALSTFHLRQIARCGYQQEDTTAAMLFIEAATPEDAFGVFSVMTAQPGALHPDGTIRAVERIGGAVVISGWQGNVYARLRCMSPPGQETPVEECEKLLVRTLFTVPSADAPWLLRALQSEKNETAKLWLARSTAALGMVEHPLFRQIDSMAMDRRLGLKGAELLAVALVRVAPDEPPNIVWLVHYETAADAQAAGQRYEEALESASGPLDANTIVDDPQGAFLIGSWTAGQESIQNLLRTLRSILPD